VRPEFLTIEFYSAFPDTEEFTVEIAERISGDDFLDIERLSFRGRCQEVAKAMLAVRLEPFRLYRATITSPVFVPRETQGADDTRQLGLAVLDMHLRGTQITEIQQRTAADLVQLQVA
jgi:hypothetical protein